MDIEEQHQQKEEQAAKIQPNESRAIIIRGISGIQQAEGTQPPMAESERKNVAEIDKRRKEGLLQTCRNHCQCSIERTQAHQKGTYERHFITAKIGLTDYARGTRSICRI